MISRASLLSALALASLVACLQHGETTAPVPGPEARCADACRKDAPSCSDATCARGCRLSMDRLVEHEQARLIACVARASKSRCDDATFAGCAAEIPYPDGGPPPPRPPSDDE